MNKRQLGTLLSIILNKYPNYKPEHFKLFFTRALAGDYGKSFDRVDGPEILNWFTKFDLELDEEIMYERQTEAAIHKQNMKDPNYQKDIYKFVGLTVNDLKKETVEKVETLDKVTPEPRKRTLEEQLIQDWMKRFHELWLKQPHEIQKVATKIIVRHTVQLDLNKYLSYRITEYHKKLNG